MAERQHKGKHTSSDTVEDLVCWTVHRLKSFRLGPGTMKLGDQLL